MRPPGINDIIGDVIRMQEQIRRLERSAPARQLIEVTAASSIDLGAIDGENITGVRITWHGVANSAVASPFRVRPNGLTSVVVSALGHGAFINTAANAYAPAEETPVFGGAAAVATGMVIGQTRFAVATTYFQGEGILYTKTGAKRTWVGDYLSIDNTADGNRFLRSYHSSVWHNSTTAITSLVLALDAGTFTGRVSVEVVL